MAEMTDAFNGTTGIDLKKFANETHPMYFIYYCQFQHVDCRPYWKLTRFDSIYKIFIEYIEHAEKVCVVIEDRSRQFMAFASRSIRAI